VMKQKAGYVPLSCGCGVVAAVGAGVTRFTVGQRVTPTFFRNWVDGERPDSAVALGGDIDGTARAYGCFAEQGLVLAPETLNDLEAATLPCAALTAWRALFVARTTLPGDVVLLQGTGGVSIAALQLAKAAGATVIITSSSDAKLRRARALGADGLINYRNTPAWGKEARRLTGGRGVDTVLDVVGADPLAQIQTQAALGPHGMIAAIGLLTGKPLWTLSEPPARTVRIYVGSRSSFEAMNRAIDARGIRPVIDRVYPLAQLGRALDALRNGQIFGKVAIQFDEPA